MAGDARAGKPKRKMSGLSEINKRGPDGQFINKDLEHVRLYMQGFVEAYGETPSIYQALSAGMADFEHVNIIYPVGDPIFIHVFRAAQAIEGQAGLRFVVVEPVLDAMMEAKYRRILELILREAPKEPPHESQDEFVETMTKLYRRVTRRPHDPEERKGRFGVAVCGHRAPA